MLPACSQQGSYELTIQMLKKRAIYFQYNYEYSAKYRQKTRE